ncbi:MAG: peptide chain release factor N(5)-glutamine methyltransferase [Bacteroidales bacterium]|nr:peptide chain release factor N(5)-glutamine methyltransferase [Bacteroidales bacterium]
MNTRNIIFKSNRVHDIVAQYHLMLDSMYGRNEVDCFVMMLFESFLGWNKTDFLLNKERTIDQSDLLRMHWALVDLQAYRPIQHIIGQVEFCGCTIEVNPHVLIPRPETAQLVDIITSGNTDVNSIADMCTGSGCLAITLKKAYPRASVTAIDNSEEALVVARNNAYINGADVAFRNANVLNLDEYSIGEQFDIIVSNPPYVLLSEKKNIMPNVLDYEPHEALFVSDNDPLCFYRAITKYASSHLNPNGRLYFEINAALSSETLRVVETCGFEATVMKDFWGKHRFIKAWL